MLLNTVLLYDVDKVWKSKLILPWFHCMFFFKFEKFLTGLQGKGEYNRDDNYSIVQK